MSPWDSAELLTLAQAAEALGIKHARPGRWLRRYLQRREEATGARLMIRVDGEGARRTSYRVSMPLVMRMCPELSERARRFEDRMEHQLVGLQQRVAALEDLVLGLTVSVAEVKDSVRTLTMALRELNRAIPRN